MPSDVSRSSSINLLQGIYAPKKSSFPHRDKLWKMSAYLAGAWVMLLFLYPTFSYFILKQHLSGVDKQIAEIYKRQFPQASDIVAPKLRMQGKLQKLTSQAGENKLLALIAYVGKEIPNSPGIKLTRFDYQNNQLTLGLSASTSEEVAAFSEALNRQGLTVKQQGATLAGTKMNATLQIE